MVGLIRKLKEAASDYDREVWHYEKDHRNNYHKVYDVDCADMRDMLLDAAKALEARL